MKKVVAIALVFGFILTSYAQKKKRRGDDFSVEQKTELALKKMTLRLDLSERQQNKIRPMLAEQITRRSTFKKNRKAKRKETKQLSKEERYERKMAHLDRKIAFKNSMKDILNTKQYEKFEKMAGKRAHKMKKKLKKRRRQKEQMNAPERA
ncbi:hypothetical protein [Tenacibaculum jejuense]|uniref:DUF4890 domain-containing protein n=1 Tax=Tenacibaculum jejuense TaxID=584609 RepID=A0A238UDE9_9FLAO|nr:hypothetical protein [Tenacibaculum jejuense]SNR17181.1 Protein of unknown function [Tenacibaculum jejuense]